MIREIQAKTMLSHRKEPDPWFGVKYNMNIYRGCQHQCIYCDSRSECYQIEDFNDVLVKVNAIPLLRKELTSKRIKGTIGFGSMSDPYTPAEADYCLTRQALEVIAEMRFPVHMLTKSDLVLRDMDLLQQINQVFAIVSFTITTANDTLAAILEPYAPLPSERLRALQTLAENGIRSGVMLMPVLPFLEDTPENITAIVEAAFAHGASYILPAMGLTLRDRQRDYYLQRLDEHFPGLSEKYQRTYGSSYSCPPVNAKALYQHFEQQCQRHGIATRVPQYIPPPAQSEQLSLF
jgi:DNA repair photolyase